MNKNIDGMEKQMYLLEDQVHHVDSSTGLVDVHLRDRKVNLQNISGVHKLLVKVCSHIPTHIRFTYSCFLSS